jgi:hypothetical protein
MHEDGGSRDGVRGREGGSGVEHSGWCGRASRGGDGGDHDGGRRNSILGSSLQQSTLAIKVEQNWYVCRVLWQDDRQRDLEITHFLVDNVLGAHLGAAVGGVCWYLCGLWCRGGFEINGG